MAFTTAFAALARGTFRAPSDRAAALSVIIAACALAPFASPAHADKIANPTAVFDGLDKITGRIITFAVKIDETVQFGTLQITPRVCYTRPPTDQPQTDGFVQVDEIDERKQEKRIFSGWMFADSPGLHGVEHPIYDVWLIDCKGGTTVIRDAPQAEASAPDENPLPGATDANAPESPVVAPPQPPKKRPKPKAPAVVAAPLPPPQENGPLDLAPTQGSGGVARGR